MSNARLQPKVYELSSVLFNNVSKENTALIRASISVFHGIIRVLQETAPHTLTVVHAHFMQACQMGNMHALAAAVAIGHAIYAVDPSEHVLTPEDYLVYFYCAGRACVRTKALAKACEMLRMCFIIPKRASVPSRLQALAYRMYILASLLAFGTVVPIKESVIAELKQHCQEYEKLATHFHNRDLERYRATLIESRAALEKSQLLSLAENVGNRIVEEKIKHLTSTYLKLTLEDIAELCGLESNCKVEFKLLDMIEAGSIRASIDREQGVVSFGDSQTHDPCSPAMADHLAGTIEEIKEVNAKLREVDTRIKLDKNYQKAVETSEMDSGGLLGSLMGGDYFGSSYGMMSSHNDEALDQALRASRHEY